MTQPIDPTLIGATPQANAVAFPDFVKAFDDSINAAQAQYDDALRRLQAAKTAKDTLDQQVAADPNKAILLGDQQKAADAEFQKAATVAEQSQSLVTRAHDAKGAAIERYNQKGNISPELAARYKADADVASANAQAQNTKNLEALAAIPENRAQLHATTQEAQANAVVAQAKADVASATTDIEKQAAQTRLDQANANLQSTQLANTQAGLQNTITAATAAVAPVVASAGATKATADATTAAAQAGVAPQAAQAAVDQAQANVNKTNQEIADLQRQARQAPTDDQAQQAIQTQLAQKQVELQSAQQALTQAQKLMPGVLAQQGATLESTQASTAATRAGIQKDLQGTLYGLQDKAKEIADMIRSGQITDPEQGKAMLQDYINSTIQGTTPFQRTQTALDAETVRRGQDYSLAGTQMNALTSAGNSLFGSMAAINKDAPAGSNAMATAYGGVMGALMNAFQGMRPNMPADSALLQSMRPMASAGVLPQPTMPSTAPGGGGPTTTIAPNGTVTIQHPSDTGLPPIPAFLPAATGYQGAPNPDVFGSGTGGLPATPLQAAQTQLAQANNFVNTFGSGTGNPPPTPPSGGPSGGLDWLMNSPASPITTPAMLSGNQLATPSFHSDLWANDPNLHPELAQTAADNST